MILCIGKEYHTSNIEGGEYSYVQEAGSRAKLEKAVGHPVDHFKLDIRFELNDIVVLIETKQSFVEKDELQLEEKAYGLSTTNMLIHGDGNSNIKFGSCFDCKNFIKEPFQTFF